MYFIRSQILFLVDLHGSCVFVKVAYENILGSRLTSSFLLCELTLAVWVESNWYL